MAHFEVDSAQVSSGAAAARASAANIRSEVAAMVAHLMNLQASWRGTAAVAFNDLLVQWQSTQQLVEQNLDSISTALDTSARQYEDVEAATTRLFAS